MQCKQISHQCITWQRTHPCTSVSLRWDRAEFARFYHVYRSADAGLTWTLVSPIFTTKYLDNGLINDKRYHYKVVSVNELGEASPSDVATQLAA